MICICSSDHFIRLGMRKIDSSRSFDYPPWDEEKLNLNLDEANSQDPTHLVYIQLALLMTTKSK